VLFLAISVCLWVSVCSYKSIRKQILRIVIKCYTFKGYTNLFTHPSSGDNSTTTKCTLHEDSKTFLRTSGIILPTHFINYPCPLNKGIPGEGEVQHHPSSPQYYMEVKWSPSLPGCFNPLYPRERNRNPLNRRLSSPHSRSGHSGWRKKFLLLQGLEPQTFQFPSVINYTDYAMQASPYYLSEWNI